MLSKVVSTQPFALEIPFCRLKFPQIERDLHKIPPLEYYSLCCTTSCCNDIHLEGNIVKGVIFRPIKSRVDGLFGLPIHFELSPYLLSALACSCPAISFSTFGLIKTLGDAIAFLQVHLDVAIGGGGVDKGAG